MFVESEQCVCVCVKVLECAELVGYFVSADIWCKMTLEQVQTSQSSASLSVLAAVIRGSQSAQLSPHLDDIAAVISHPNVCHLADVRTHLLTYLLSVS